MHRKATALIIVALMIALPINAWAAGGGANVGGSVGAGVGAAGTGSAAVGGGSPGGRVGGGPPTGAVGGGTPGAENPSGNGAAGSGNPQLNAVGVPPSNTSPELEKTSDGIVRGNTAKTPASGPVATSPAIVGADRPEQPPPTAGSAQPVLDGMLNQPETLMPCGTAANETDGSTTCVEHPIRKH